MFSEQARLPTLIQPLEDRHQTSVAFGSHRIGDVRIPTNDPKTSHNYSRSTYPSSEHLVQCDAPGPPVACERLRLPLDTLWGPVRRRARETPPIFVWQLEREAEVRQTNVAYEKRRHSHEVSKQFLILYIIQKTTKTKASASIHCKE